MTFHTQLKTTLMHCKQPTIYSASYIACVLRKYSERQESDQLCTIPFQIIGVEGHVSRRERAIIPALNVLLSFFLSPALCSRTFSEHCLIFLQTKTSAHRLRIILGLLGLSVDELHGNLTQLQVKLKNLFLFAK